MVYHQNHSCTAIGEMCKLCITVSQFWDVCLWEEKVKRPCDWLVRRWELLRWVRYLRLSCVWLLWLPTVRGKLSTECSEAGEEREEVGCEAEICNRALELTQVLKEVELSNFLMFPAQAILRHLRASQSQERFASSILSWRRFNNQYLTRAIKYFCCPYLLF